VTRIIPITIAVGGENIMLLEKLDGAGVPIAYDGHGNDYMKAPVEEQIELKNGRARWKIAANKANKPSLARAFYLR